jgi:lipopolysaccharide/colanic/teichoic acid biosynthesis glycosyltransferase
MQPDKALSSDQPDVGRRGSYKVWFDLSFILVAHVSLFPIFLLLWIIIPIMIWLGDRGPVFYQQKRIGKNGKIISVRKFRTMIVDADTKGPAWTTPDDPRITTIGRILRKTALDELPEVLNICKREMSLVGPRALDVAEQAKLEKQIPGFERRLCMLPGLTGMAQVYDPEDDADDKLNYDMEYLYCMGPLLDLKLVILSVLNTAGARWDRRDAKPMDDE